MPHLLAQKRQAIFLVSEDFFLGWFISQHLPLVRHEKSCFTLEFHKFGQLFDRGKFHYSRLAVRYTGRFFPFLHLLTAQVAEVSGRRNVVQAPFIRSNLERAYLAYFNPGLTGAERMLLFARQFTGVTTGAKFIID
jgi:hypothetical protein